MKTIKIFLVLTILAAFASTPGYAQDLDVVYVPTRQPIVDAMLKLADVKASDVVYDLGCGDGRIVISAAKDYGAKGKGIDIDPKRVDEAKLNAAKADVQNLVEFEVGDLFEADVREASVVTLYLLSTLNLKLKPILLEQLKPGTRIVSHAFSMGDWEPEKTEKVDGATIYLWTVPEK